MQRRKLQAVDHPDDTGDAEMNTQEQRLLEHLQSGKTITRLDALTELGLFELSARIVGLEQKGYVIDRKRITVTNRFGEQIKVAEYWLRQEMAA